MSNEPVTKDFDFLDYVSGLEKMLWANHTHSTLSGPKHGGNLGEIREHFVENILKKVVPNTVSIGKGEITNGRKRSKQQDIVLYRSDFPVFRYGSINLYMVEGVIATIEVKSDLKTDNPNQLTRALENVKSVNSIENYALILKGDQEDLRKLQSIHSPKTFVIGYKGWNSLETCVDKYTKTITNLGINSIPMALYQPGFCAIQNTPYANFGTGNMENLTKVDHNKPLIGFTSKNPFALFFQQLLKAIVFRTSITATIPGINAEMQYDFKNYFSIPNTPLEKWLEVEFLKIE